jgi:hypothetical protein
MSPWIKIIIRSALSLALAIILSQWFFQRTSYPAIISLTIFFIGMAYLSEYIRKRG